MKCSTRAQDDSGSVLVLMIGFLVLAAMLVVVVVHLSRVFLHDRALSAAADGAALAAVQAVDESAIYGGAFGQSLPLDSSAVDQRVEDYVVASGLTSRFDDFAVIETRVESGRVVVVLRATVDLPFDGIVSQGWTGGVPISAESRATAPLR
jgi:Flp pilus assembly protein TadG